MTKSTFLKSTILLAMSTLLFSSTVFADGVANRPYLALGADLKETEKTKVLELLDVDDDLSNYNVVTITNQQEHDALDDYLSSSIIGSRALSSVLVERSEKGDGISVTTKNITYCTEGMYQNALTTAGIEDAKVTVAGPFEITGTAALVGVMNAYEDMTGEDISTKSKDAATNELVVTGALASQLQDSEKAEEFIAYVKEKVLSSNIQSTDDILSLINDACDDLDITLTDEQKQTVADLMQKINSLDLNVDEIKQQASQIYDKLKDMDIDTQGLFDTIVSVFKAIFGALEGILS